jgi:hypothetical protein
MNAPVPPLSRDINANALKNLEVIDLEILATSNRMGTPNRLGIAL